jgi:transposase
VVEVATRIGIPKHTLYEWVHKVRKAARVSDTVAVADKSEAAEVRRLKAELKRVTEERDILKKAAAYFARG